MAGRSEAADKPREREKLKRMIDAALQNAKDYDAFIAEMIKQGCEVAQVLGIRDLNVTKRYIPLDSIHLKECAISFAGIAPHTRRGEA